MHSDYTIRDDGTLTVDGRIYVTDKDELKFKLLDEAHQTP